MLGAIDIGGTKIAVGLVTRNGDLIASRSWNTDPDEEALVGLDRITKALQELTAETQTELVGIGAAITGPVDFSRGFLGNNAFLPKWSGLPFVTHMIQRLGVPVFIDNDAMASTQAEYLWGSGVKKRHFIYITVSTGIGVGVVLNNEVYRGANGAHGECGHMVIDFRSTAEPCFCGARGCWESLASGTAMARRWREEFPEHPLDAKQICAAARRGFAPAKKAVALEGRLLGIGIANLITQYVPEAVSLGGGVMESFDLFASYITEQVSQQCGLVPWERVSIGAAKFGASAGLIGAAAIFPLQQYGLTGLDSIEK